MKKACLGFVLLSLVVSALSTKDPPVFNDTYRAAGVIRLPYAEIIEPFSALFDGKGQRSRVDYYQGIQKTIQLSKTKDNPYGTNYKIIPFTDKTVTNKVTCFQVNGTVDNPAETISVFPDIRDFLYSGQFVVRERMCDVYQKKVTVGKKISTYTMYVTVDGRQPWRYEMFGYDSLLGSHFDKYYVDYDFWQAPTTFMDSEFEVPDKMPCQGYPGPGLTAEDKVLMNPITEYVHHYDAHVHETFDMFKKTHGKLYKSSEHQIRKDIFKQNLRFIHSKNRAGLSYSMKVNHLADQSDNEMKKRRGFRYSHGDHGGAEFQAKTMKNDVPDQWDWRLLGAVTPVKDQAICGSCWSFGTTGTIEGANFLKTKKLVVLSQQELIDCSWGYGNNGCDGGEDFRAYKWMMDNGGLTSYEQYGQYKAIDSYCKKDSVKPVVQLSNYTTLPQGDLNALKVALFNKGPISVAIDASHKSFGFYADGVYYEPACKSDPDSLDHAVLAVGYGELNGEKYWLVKNSWSTYWGNDGYVLMSQKNNNCGVATDATYVDIA